LGPAVTDEIVRFFTTYNELKGKRFEVLAIEKAARACKLVDDAAVGKF
jgi:inorganic pyrophosphatase